MKVMVDRVDNQVMEEGAMEVDIYLDVNFAVNLGIEFMTTENNLSEIFKNDSTIINLKIQRSSNQHLINNSHKLISPICMLRVKH